LKEAKTHQGKKKGFNFSAIKEGGKMGGPIASFLKSVLHLILNKKLVGFGEKPPSIAPYSCGGERRGGKRIL